LHEAVFKQEKLTDWQVFIGTHSVRLYHGYRSGVEGTNNGRRVDHRDTLRNTRSALITCPPGQLFYLGYRVPARHHPQPTIPVTNPIPATFQTLLNTFGTSLWNQGIVNSNGLGMVFDGPRLVATVAFPNGQFDLNRRQPTVRHRGNNGAMYQDSLLPAGTATYLSNSANIPP
jgi:hypothetical protein